MFKNLTIQSKLRLNVFLVIIGIGILIINFYSSLNTLEHEYLHTKKLHEETGALKSMFIGGLMVNSSKGVLFITKSAKAVKTMAMGKKKLNIFYGKLKKLDSELANSLSHNINEFNAIVNILLNKAQNGVKFSEKDMKESLSIWRRLKKKIRSPLQPLKKKVILSSKRYDDHIKYTLNYFLLF